MHPGRYSEIRWLASQVRPFLRLHLAGYFCVVITSILALVDPLIVRRLIDDVIPHRRVSWLPVVAAAFFLTYVGRMGFDSPSFLASPTIPTICSHESAIFAGDRTAGGRSSKSGNFNERPIASPFGK